VGKKEIVKVRVAERFLSLIPVRHHQFRRHYGEDCMGIWWIDWTRSSPPRLQTVIAPAFFHPQDPQEIHRPTLLDKLTQEPILYIPQNSERYKMSELHINDNINCFNNTNVWNNCTVADERSEILAWLSPLKPRIRHQDIRTRRVDGVGGWLLQTQEYRNLFGGIRGGESGGAALFCYGGPGVGKTFIR